MRYLAGLCLALVAALPLAAQQGAVFDVLDQRGKMLGWEAVGRLDLPGGFCTGALIAPDLVLTAAHCVFDARGGGIEPRGMLFRAGYSHGRSITDRRVSRWVVAEGYVPGAGGRASGESIARDVALLQLESPVSSAEADPFRIRETPAGGTRVSVVSYGRGREEVLSREPDCALVQRYRGAVLGFDCDVTFGSSGAPVFVREDGRLRILSVISAGTNLGGAGGEAFGPSLQALVPELRARLRREDALPPVSTGARRITVGSARTVSGARFVRP